MGMTRAGRAERGRGPGTGTQTATASSSSSLSLCLMTAHFVIIQIVCLSLLPFAFIVKATLKHLSVCLFIRMRSRIVMSCMNLINGSRLLDK